MSDKKQLFMRKQSEKDFVALQQHVGQKIKICYLLMGSPRTAIGTLLAVKPFESIIFTGGEVPFVSREKLIREIQGPDGKSLFDRTYIIPSNAVVKDGLLGRYKLEILGALQPPATDLNTTISGHNLDQKDDENLITPAS